ncbi:hypothetical protein [Novosphingobium sp. MBES04]|nr:hypothetical protein [Novosphingobium sp. MBES04]GAM07565.1 hypothetical protein MBENS4_4561 [Novosphingobium sp. MBES04]
MRAQGRVELSHRARDLFGQAGGLNLAQFAPGRALVAHGGEHPGQFKADP